MELLQTLIPTSTVENPFTAEESGLSTTTPTTLDRVKSTFIAMTPQHPVAKYVFYLLAIGLLGWVAYNTVIFALHMLIVVLLVYFFGLLILWFKETPK